MHHLPLPSRPSHSHTVNRNTDETVTVIVPSPDISDLPCCRPHPAGWCCKMVSVALPPAGSWSINSTVVARGAGVVLSLSLQLTQYNTNNNLHCIQKFTIRGLQGLSKTMLGKLSGEIMGFVHSVPSFQYSNVSLKDTSKSSGNVLDNFE